MGYNGDEECRRASSHKNEEDRAERENKGSSSENDGGINERKLTEIDNIEASGGVVTGKKGESIHCLSIIGQIEGHYFLPEGQKATKYEHIIPMLVSIEQDEEIDGLLILLNTMGGDVAGTPGIKMVGPAGEIDIAEGVIIAKRHIHFDTATANEMGIADKQIVKVKIDSDRTTIFDDVVCRVSDAYAFAMHIDTDECNAACAFGEVYGEIIK